VNIAKVREMCRMIRKLSPNSTIVIGGHIAAIPGVNKMIDADHIVRGEGVSWMRRYLGEDRNGPIRHPAIVSGMRTRIMGVRLPEHKGATAATIIPSVGCPMGCNFCTTSAFFGGKGNFVNFFESGDELFEVMQQMETELKVQSFFVMDENFLLHRERAMRLLERMKEGQTSWSMSVFASANAIGKYTMQELVELGVSWLWMGLESPQARYNKLQGTDTRQLTRELREHGIRVQGSTIIGLEHHTPDNIIAEIEHAVSHDTDFHQFMLYTPVPGTPLYQGRCRKKDACCATRTTLTFTANSSSISSTQPSRVTTRSDFWIGRSGATSRSMAQVCTASRARCWPDGSATKTGPIRAFVNSLPVPAKCTSSTASIVRPFGRWNASSGKST
jgi:radical SAM superfamily enzyme YgiQ (UPF0313 family)